ncbi:ribonuclease H1 domain-containing protein [Paramaledivibacter caminithermalis]|jgi:ribonuclease HI|uniref:Ribonuclease H n=1 Tax=Paramaledivibacter caminithermalis (strain DSM 15212 / CIP 107654 / DViRD3) TaxID=1121301 RepID=A0A1M6QWU7_PARC5|nr:ribonuclease H family protein [Paramaledivibacter caminithermalis]SHK24558.1 ribonuclease HI [Paramaledivibacter caminithermalis DSM 15212]
MSEKKSKYVYAVRKGEKTGIFNSWAECEKQVKGYSGAEFKKFKTEKEALEYINNCNDNNNEKDVFSVDEFNKLNSEVIAYVDGSYDSKTHQYGSGVVILYKEEKITISKLGDNKDLADMRNVAGEIKGAEIAMEFALKEKASSLTIYHDYEGIEKWCSGSWKARKAGTMKYKEYYDEVSDKVKIKFVKVKAHSGDKYNEEADQLAKKALGLV